ncbi:Laminin subunit alpha-2 [Halotydeus destructor]|nr:Laminin subunit alpha-2 [Halotydeus destructor]
MDFDSSFGTTLLSAAFVAIAGAIVFVVSYMSGIFKETSYDEAVLSKREKVEITNPSAKALKKEKKDKEKKEKEKKKEKKLAKRAARGDNDNDGSKKSEEQTSSEQCQIVGGDVVATPEEAKVTPLNHKEHVEFETVNQVVILDDDLDTIKQRRPSMADEKPRKPILVHKADSLNLTDSEIPIQSKPFRGNSFEVRHPKDDFELVKHKEEKARSLASSRDDLSSELNAEKAITNGHPENVDLVDSEKLPLVKESVKASKRQRKSKSLANPVVEPVRNETLTAANLLQSAKALSHEEIQYFVDELLNSLGDERQDTSEWRQARNDPQALLKKRMEDVEDRLRIEEQNAVAAKGQVHHLRLELDQKLRLVHELERRSQQQQLLVENATATVMKRAEEKERHLERTLAGMNSKAIKMEGEFRQIMADRDKIKDENLRLVQALKHMESERPSAEILAQLQNEVEQLRNERQQFVGRHNAVQNQNDDLQRQIQKLEEALNAMRNSRQKEEYGFQQQVGEVSNQLQKSEAARSAIQEELARLHSDFTGVEANNSSLLKKADEAINEKNDMIAQLQSKLNEIDELKLSLQKSQESTQTALKQAESSEKAIALDNSSQLEEMEKKYESINAEVERLRQNLQQEQTKVSDLQQRNEQVEQQLSASESKVGSSETEKQELWAKLEAALANHSLLEKKVIDVESQTVKLQSDKEALVNAIRLVVPNSDESIDSLSENLLNLKQQQETVSSASSEELEELQNKVKSQESELVALQSEITNYKSTLSTTDEILRRLESKALEEQEQWAGRLRAADEAASQLEADNKALRAQKSELESSIKELQGLGNTVADMEAKLRDLQAKLQGEEQEKRVLNSKYEEASSKVNNVQDELDKRTKEVESLAEAGAEIEKIKADNERLQSDLEKDRKSIKELQTQVVKLKSLVKIGEDSFKAEQARINELQEQLKLRNGSTVSSSTPCLAGTNGTNGTTQELNDSSTSLNIANEDATVSK